LLATVDSPPLADIIRSINKYSNNVMARRCYSRWAEVGARTTVGHSGGARMAQTSARFPELARKRAGLSREEAISARHLAKSRSPLGVVPLPNFVSSLPISAMDGTCANG
jgi:D-alanyl-D-alanine carboxypeptidase/D-alanyl-D-alanine-endopeptidase (penicillin-binding protein 4)